MISYKLLILPGIREILQFFPIHYLLSPFQLIFIFLQTGQLHSSKTIPMDPSICQFFTQLMTIYQAHGMPRLPIQLLVASNTISHLTSFFLSWKSSMLQHLKFNNTDTNTHVLRHVWKYPEKSQILERKLILSWILCMHFLHVFCCLLIAMTPKMQ